MKKFKILALVMTCAILLSSIMIPVSAVEPNNTPAVSIDGVADEAIWTNPTATYELKYSTSSSDCKTSATAETENISTVKFAYDADYLYICFETTHTFNTSSDYFRFQLRPDASKALNTATYGSNFTGETLQLSVYTQTSADETTYYWHVDGQQDSSTLIKSDKGSFSNCVNTAAACQFTSGNSIYDNTQIALRKANGKKTLEIKYPLVDSYKTALQTAGGANLYIGLREYSYYNKANYNYFATQTVGNSYCNSGHADECLTLNLPSLIKEAKTEPVLVGFQSRTNEEDGTYDVRFVSVVNNYTGFKTDASKLGYLFTNAAGQTSTQYCSKIYTELNVGEGTIKPSDFGSEYEYFFCFTIMGLDQNAAEAYTLGVSCFTQKNAEADVEYCQNPVTVAITYNKAEGKAVFN